VNKSARAAAGAAEQGQAAGAATKAQPTGPADPADPVGRRAGQVVLRMLVTVALLAVAVAALVVAWGDAPAVLRAVAGFPPALAVPVLLLTVWNYVLRWLRWNWYLRVLGVSGIDPVSSALVFLSGFAMGLTPGKSGEVTKSYWLREIAGSKRAPLARTAPMVFAERLVDGIAMLLLAASGLISSRFGLGALLGVAGLAGCAVLLIQARPLVHGVLDVLGPYRALELARTLYDSARELLTLPRLLIAVGIGVVSWAGECMALYVIVLGLGASPSLDLAKTATFALAAGSLIGSASLLPGGLGAAEGTVAAVLTVVAGQPRELAAAATLLIRACTLWFGVALGAVALVVLTRRALTRATESATGGAL
jgi:glycosyltransferase 2 family protein